MQLNKTTKHCNNSIYTDTLSNDPWVTLAKGVLSQSRNSLNLSEDEANR